MADTSRDTPNPRRADWPRTLVALLLGLFVWLSYGAALGKSPTYDEPLHLFSTWVYRYLGDYTVVCDHPPLWVYWASVPMPPHGLRADTSSEAWHENLDEMRSEDAFAYTALYDDPGVDSDRLLQRARLMMVLLGVALGALLALWARRLGGGLAAVVTTAFFVLDPAFLGHAALVKNDVAAALATIALIYVVWRTGQRATPVRIVAAALLCGAAINTKFSLLQCGPIVALLLVLRALSREPWEVAGRRLVSRTGRLLAVAAMLVFMLATSVLCTWALYRFRFAPTSNPSLAMDTAGYLNDIRLRSTMVRHPMQMPTPAELATWVPPASVQAILWLIDHHAMPSAWLHGILFVYSHAIARSSFLLGHVGATSPWYFVPFEILVKTPVGTLCAILGAVLVGLILLVRGGRMASTRLWDVTCLLLPPAILFGSALASSLGIGLRHILPAWAFVLLLIGIVASRAATHWKRPVILVVSLLVMATAVETLHAAPDFIAFFNLPAGGPRGGLRLLGDSNLDWGQDLPALARWQQAHRDRPLYLSYAGFADPAAYGIQYRAMPGNRYRRPDPVVRPAYAAVSATMLQAIYLTGATRDYYQRFLDLKPIAVLDGTIYVYDALPE